MTDTTRDTVLNDGFFEYLTNEGLHYETRLVENYLLSLKVKPFLILSGGSGTGKTKLAQTYSKYICPKLPIFDSIF